MFIIKEHISKAQEFNLILKGRVKSRIKPKRFIAGNVYKGFGVVGMMFWVAGREG